MTVWSTPALAVGARLVAVAALTVTRTMSVPVAPLESVTVSVRVWLPTPNVTVADAPVTPVPRVDPVHLYVIVSPSGSEPLPLNVTEAVVAPEAAVTVWSTPALAVGAVFVGGGGVAGTLAALPGKVPAVISAMLVNPSPSESAPSMAPNAAVFPPALDHALP